MASITTELVETGAKRDERGRKITTPAERAWSRPGSRLCGMYSSGRRPPIRESCDRVICRNGEQSDAAGDNVRDPDAWQMRMPGVAARRPAPSEPDTAPLRNRIALGELGFPAGRLLWCGLRHGDASPGNVRARRHRYGCPVGGGAERVRVDEPGGRPCSVVPPDGQRTRTIFGELPSG